MQNPSLFTIRHARSASLLIGMMLAIAVESAALHLWLAPTSPRIAWMLTALSLGTAGWLWGDFRAMGRHGMVVDTTDVHVRVGWRAVSTVPRSSIVSAIRPTWRERPSAGTAGYVNLTKPADPNTLLTCDPPATIRLVGGLTRRVRVIGLHVDDADALRALLNTASAGAAPELSGGAS
jgi:hypothetical protein